MRRLHQRLERRREDSSGYLAILMAILMLLLFSMSAFAVDVGTWYLTGQRLQKAADAAALSGVPHLPGDTGSAFQTARETSAANGFTDGADSAVVKTEVDGQPTRLRVTVESTVDNSFGALLGISETTIVRTSVADFAGPVAMGSPCNGFGNDPDPGSARGNSCAGVSGEFWANINSYETEKEQGDRRASHRCTTPTDLCGGGVNSEFDPEGYYYTLTVPEGLPDIIIEAFDPAWVNTAAQCNDATAFGGTLPRDARNPYVTDESVRYGAGTGASGKYCTGDGFSGMQGQSSTWMTTQFEVRAPGANPWDVTTYPVLDQTGCEPISFPGYHGPLYRKLNATSGAYDDYPVIAPHFRRWTTLCTIANPPAGEYLVRVSVPPDAATGSNHFSLRAYPSYGGGKDLISVAGREAMSIYSNDPQTGVTEFYLARVPSGSAGKELQVELFDAGDSNLDGRIKVVAPPGSGVKFENCVGTGPSSGLLTDCSFAVSRTTHNGRVQGVRVPIPSKYKCNDDNLTLCWVRLHYTYGHASAPTDVTTWQVSLLGDPVRLVE